MKAKKLLSLHQVEVCTAWGASLLQIDEWAVNQGEWIHVRGANGSGKSTLVKLLTGRTGQGLKIHGSVERSPELERPFPYVMQHPEAAIVGTTPWEDLLLGLEQSGMAAELIMPRLEQALASVGLKPLQHRPVAELSGGQKQLVAIAGCLASDAPLLVLDEAVSMLDLAARQYVLRAVREQHRRGMTVIWVSHGSEDIEPADRIVELRAGKIIQDSASGCGHAPVKWTGGMLEEAHEHDHVQAQAQASLHAETPVTVRPSERCGDHAGAASCCLEQPMLRGTQNAGKGSMESAGQWKAEAANAGRSRVVIDSQPLSLSPRPAADWVLSGVTVGAGRSGSPLLQDVSVRLAAGTLTLIVGRNGAGKTTLLESLAGLRELKHGEIRLGEQSLWDGRRLNQQVLLELGVSLQHSESQWFLPRAEQELRYSLRPYRLPEQEQQARAAAGLQRAGLAPETAQRDPWTLSGGQQRRLAWACLLAAKPSWLLLDEPTAGLDSEGIALLRAHLAAHLAAGGGAVIVTHDVDVFAGMAADVLHLEEGKMRGVTAHAGEAASYTARATGLPELVEPTSSSDLQSAEGLEKGGFGTEAVRRGIATATGSKREREQGSWAAYDPRALWLAYLLLAGGILLQMSWTGVLLGNAIAAAVLLRGRAALRPWHGLIAWYAGMAAAFCLLSGIRFSPPGLEVDVMNRTALYFCRLLPVMVLGLGLAAAMTPFRLQRAVEQVIRPLRRFRLPVDMIALTVSLVFRFIPLLSAEWSKLARIAQARGKRGGRAGKVPARDLHRVLLPYLVLLLRMADQMAEALEARGFAARGVQPTRAWQLHLKAQDGYLAAGGALLLAILATCSLWLG